MGWQDNFEARQGQYEASDLLIEFRQGSGTDTSAFHERLLESKDELSKGYRATACGAVRRIACTQETEAHDDEEFEIPDCCVGPALG